LRLERRRGAARLVLLAFAVAGHARRLVDGKRRDRQQQQQSGAGMNHGRRATQPDQTTLGRTRIGRRDVRQVAQRLRVQQQDENRDDVDDELHDDPVVTE